MFKLNIKSHSNLMSWERSNFIFRRHCMFVYYPLLCFISFIFLTLLAKHRCCERTGLAVTLRMCAGPSTRPAGAPGSQPGDERAPGLLMVSLLRLDLLHRVQAALFSSLLTSRTFCGRCSSSWKYCIQLQTIKQYVFDILFNC